MRRGLWCVMLTACLSYPVQAQTIEEKAQICSGCHGETGIPQAATTPIIWGQQLGYLYLELRDYKSGARKNEQMSVIASGLEKSDILELATFFSKKQWPYVGAKEASAAAIRAAKTVDVSIGCTGCHLDAYQGDSSVPRLAGQQPEYLKTTMLMFRSSKRGNNPGMSALMQAANLADMDTMSGYLSSLTLAPE